MTAEIDTFTRVYRGVRAALARTEWPPSKQLRVDELAAAYRTSATPVREALARLAGERLVLEDRRRGHFVPRLGADAIRQLLGLSELLLVAALGVNEPHQPSPIREFDTRRAAPVLLAVLAGSGNATLLDSGALTIERLAFSRAVESEVLNASNEVEDLVELVRPVRRDRSIRLIRDYHRRRYKAADDLARAIARRAEPGPQYIPDMV